MRVAWVRTDGEQRRSTAFVVEAVDDDVEHLLGADALGPT
jgi:hypothetical protein